MNERCLPPIEAFSSKLGVGGNISIADFNHAQEVWFEFNCQTIKDYTEIYCELDVILLAELFSAFKDNCKKVKKDMMFLKIISIYLVFRCFSRRIFNTAIVYLRRVYLLFRT